MVCVRVRPHKDVQYSVNDENDDANSVSKDSSLSKSVRSQRGGGNNMSFNSGHSHSRGPNSSMTIRSTNSINSATSQTAGGAGSKKKDDSKVQVYACKLSSSVTSPLPGVLSLSDQPLSYALLQKYFATDAHFA